MFLFGCFLVGMLVDGLHLVMPWVPRTGFFAEGGQPPSVVALLFLAFLSALVLFVAWLVLPRDLVPPRRSRLYLALSEDGADIAWGYSMTVRARLGSDSHYVKVHFADGKNVQQTASAKDVDRLLLFIQSKVPNVIMGYGLEQQVEYAELLEKRGIFFAPSNLHDVGRR